MSTTGMVMSITDELLAELDRGVRVVWHDDDSVVIAVDALAAELRRLRAENAELAKDAGRYRWLSKKLVGASFDWDGEGMTALAFEMPDSITVSANCDAVIDTAMATK